MGPTLGEEALAPLVGWLEEAVARLRERFPGDSGERQPVHTVYGGAHLFRRGTAERLGALALQALETHAPDAASLARALGLEDEALAAAVRPRVLEKLQREPVEDFRIDFEDGYGQRGDEQEDGDAVRVAEEIAAGAGDESLPPFLGLRVKPFTPELWRRSLRTLDLVLTGLAERGGAPPPGFVVTLPKVTGVEEVEALARLLELLEERLGFPEGCLGLEVMIETPQAILDPGGRAAPPALVEAARGRCVAAHFGTYDYTASLGITAAHQHMAHPACDFARHLLQVSLAGHGVWLSDGATNVLPVPRHEGRPEDLTEAQRWENREAIHQAWRLHHRHVRHSLELGYYQGWDLHPAQLVSRYAALYGFFLESLERAGGRLRNFVEKAARATLAGDVFDDAATGQGLLNFFLRALSCGAVTEDEVLERTGLAPEDLRTRSFPAILERRSGQ